MTSMVKIVRGADEARRTLLKRRALADMEASSDVQQGTQELFGEPLTPDQVVSRILGEVRDNGDQAVFKYTELLDHTKLDSLRVPQKRILQAWENTSTELQEALQLCAKRISSFYEKQPWSSWLDWDGKGGALGQMLRPLERVGIYAPNGRAPYPSSVLMGAIPARVAGVPEIVLATPPHNGELNDTILAAAYVAGVQEVYAMGGAQAIGALAYGTETVGRVDKILGPGNIFVVLAKRQVFGLVDIDQLPGPTETLLVADDSANPRYCAADMLAQAEHDPMASALLITPSEALALAVAQELEEQVKPLSRQEIIRESFSRQSGIVVCASIDEAIDLANEYAAEHLCLITRDPYSQLGRIKNAGGVFLGELSCEALGDYAIGPSHVMPTGQTARFSSPLNVWDFLKITSVFGIDEEMVRTTGPAGMRVAEEEGLTAHAQAIRVRYQDILGKDAE